MKPSTKQLLLTGASQMISGLAVGWLIGLSVSPTLQTVLTSILAVIVSLTSVLAGLSPENTTNQTSPLSKVRINASPVTFLMIGLAVGASCGVYARTNLWLSADAKKLAQRTGLKEEQINQRIFDLFYSAGTSKPATSPEAGAGKAQDGEAKSNPTPEIISVPTPATAIPGLHNLEIQVSECDQLRSLQGERLLRELQVQPDPKVRALAKRANEEKTDPKFLTLFVEEVLCPKSN